MENKEDKIKDASKAKGGFARAQSLTTEERKAIARKGAEARWNTDVPIAEYEGDFPLGNATISAVVLPNGKRLITQATFLRALGRSRSPKAGTGVFTTVDGLPFFLQADALKPFISDELRESTTPIFYRTKNGKRGVGYDAELLPRVCEVYLNLRDSSLATKGKVGKQYKHIVDACDLLIRALAHVGIISLIDEATGYQYDRARYALAEILENFISKELIKWATTFPDEFYKQIFRLKGWTPNDIATRRPKIFGKITNDLVYERLAANVLKHLEHLNPKNEKGQRRHKHFQRLTPDVGHPELVSLLTSEITIMRGFDDGKWDEFYKFLNRVLPKQTPLPLFDNLSTAELEA
jgi:hypothetical protein